MNSIVGNGLRYE